MPEILLSLFFGFEIKDQRSVSGLILLYPKSGQFGYTFVLSRGLFWAEFYINDPMNPSLHIHPD